MSDSERVRALEEALRAARALVACADHPDNKWLSEEPSVCGECLADLREALVVVGRSQEQEQDLGDAQGASCETEELLRREWWMSHGHDYASLYGDDGEMQCSACPADFKRAPLAELQHRVFLARASRAAPPVPQEPGQAHGLGGAAAPSEGSGGDSHVHG